MKKLKLTIREKGRYIEIPGVAAFRTPATMDVTKIKLSILIQALHSCGVNNYELVSEDEKGSVVYLGKDPITKLPEKKNDPELSNRLERMEDLLLKLISNGTGQKAANSEQITNRLNRIERMLKQGNKVIYKEIGGNPIVEEMDDQYIPEIDISDMKISGNITKTLGKTSKGDIDSVVDMLSNLTKNGGK
jgi:hypothetical protein